MLCCLIAAGLIVRFLLNWREARKYLGFAPPRDDNPYGWEEYCELDDFAS
ncbi:MAG: hypothetical protein LBH17_04940 [Oscillospiraceae bacterium]|jgi:hypothetical protein|nr:hypothetical protein [Oscillospiraceae bacterium]